MTNPDWNQIKEKVVMGSCKYCGTQAYVDEVRPKDFNFQEDTITCPTCGKNMIPCIGDKIITIEDAPASIKKEPLNRMPVCLDDYNKLT